MKAAQPLTLTQGVINQTQLPLWQIAQATMNDASRAAGGASRKIVLLDQQRALPRSSALARDGHAVDSASHDQHLKAFAVERLAWLDKGCHFQVGCFGLTNLAVSNTSQER